ncbi:MAG: phosphatidylglycerophosphatase A [Chitinispirillaceae bacterium]|nr:phosphatidylglycerophosphatase A [Chitinispirillaceae bacterium]
MSSNTLGRFLRKTGASFFFVGYLPASGTVASCIVIVFLWLLNGNGVLASGGPAYWLISLTAVGCSFFLSSRSRELFGREDSGRIVIDEVAGQLVTFCMVPLTLRTLIAGFLLFRFFDIVKPFPVYRMESLDDGVGVTMDDVAAGICANASLLVIVLAYHAIKGYLQ